MDETMMMMMIMTMMTIMTMIDDDDDNNNNNDVFLIIHTHTHRQTQAARVPSTVSTVSAVSAASTTSKMSAASHTSTTTSSSSTTTTTTTSSSSSLANSLSHAQDRLYGAVSSLRQKVNSYVRKDEDHLVCTKCDNKFTLLNPAEQCSNCQASFCKTCVNRVLCEVRTKPLPMCDTCFREKEDMPDTVALPPTLPVSKRTKKNVLALDGGGLRGVFTLVVLMELEKQLGRKLREVFDLIIGTSTGGFIALGVGMLDTPLEDILKLYEELGRDAFVAESTKKVLSTMHRYDVGALEFLLRKMFGRHTTLKQTQPKVAVTAVAWDEKPSTLHLIRSYQGPASSCRGVAESMRIWEAARATSAAPTYFHPFHCHGRTFVDGGLLANDPALVAYAEASALFGGQEHINMLVSVGTGKRKSSREDRSSQYIWSLTRDLVSTCVHADTNEVALPLIMGHQRYARLQGEVRHREMDNPKLIPYWKKDAANYLASEEGKAAMSAIVAQLRANEDR